MSLAALTESWCYGKVPHDDTGGRAHVDIKLLNIFIPRKEHCHPVFNTA